MIKSCGILPYRIANTQIEVFLIHPGGPYFKNRDLLSWGIAKGIQEPGESLIDTAVREFTEETGFIISSNLTSLGHHTASSKTNYIWATNVPELDPDAIVSNTFQLEWPPNSSTICTFDEVDRAAWFNLEDAYPRIFKNQSIFLDRLVQVV